jgi:hypothetical protein
VTASRRAHKQVSHKREHGVVDETHRQLAPMTMTSFGCGASIVTTRSMAARLATLRE